MTSRPAWPGRRAVNLPFDTLERMLGAPPHVRLLSVELQWDQGTMRLVFECVDWPAGPPQAEAPILATTSVGEATAVDWESGSIH